MRHFFSIFNLLKDSPLKYAKFTPRIIESDTMRGVIQKWLPAIKDLLSIDSVREIVSTNFRGKKILRASTIYCKQSKQSQMLDFSNSKSKLEKHLLYTPINWKLQYEPGAKKSELKLCF